MATAVIENLDQFKAFLATQPLCQWAAQKQKDLDAGITTQKKGVHHKPDDNADLAAALSSMA